MSLRARLIGLLVAAIVAVVVLAAGATALVVDGPDDGMRARSAADAVVAVARLVDGSPARARDAGLTLAPPPPSAGVDADGTADIVGALRSVGSSWPAVVEATGERTRQVAFPVTDTEWSAWPCRAARRRRSGRSRATASS